MTRSYLDEFLLDGLCSLQLGLDHLDELGRSVFCLNVAETSFFDELQEKQGGKNTFMSICWHTPEPTIVLCRQH